MRRCYRPLIIFILGLSTTLLAIDLQAQNHTFEYSVELQGTAGTDDYVPFWLYSNKRGTVDMSSPGSSALLDFHKNLMPDEEGFDYGFGTTFVSRYSENETFFFSQLYASIAYGAFRLKGGRYYEHLGTTDRSLSMGSLAISPNAVPMPKITFGVPDYSPVPLTRGFVEFKAEIAHGWFEEDRKIESPWLHQKYGYLRFGGDFAFTPYLGLTNQATWAGTGNETEGDLDDSFSDFWRVVFARSGTGDQQFGENYYKLGDHRGIWDFGFNLELADYDILGYRQYIYNDKDGLKLQTPDALTGLSINFPDDGQQLVTGVLWEYLYTKDQSGPIAPFLRDGPGGRDNYYNNYLYRSGWTYEGRTIGNPLFLTAQNPQLEVVSNYLVNPDDKFGIANNRIVAHHFGLEGQFSRNFNYKLLGTWSRNYGLYYDADLLEEYGLETDFINNPEQWSFLAEFSYQPPSFQSLQFNASVAADTGELYEDRIGVMFGIKLLGNSSF